MTALVNAARAIVASEQDEWELPAAEWDAETLERHGILRQARAVLMAVLPTLKRSNCVVGDWLEDDEGQWVEYDDLAAILNEEPK